jgi:thiamine pyrophosphokinase
MAGMSKFVILLSGDVTPTTRLKNQLVGARVIAADSGMKHAEVLNLTPELWVGDFDSTPTALRDQWSRVPQERYPAAKDKTDGELAVDAALKLGATEILMLGAFGGQLDHVLAHGTQLIGLAARNIKAFASSGREEAWPLIKDLTFWQIPRGTRVSVVGLCDLKALSILGVRWPLLKRDVPLGSTLTLSNESDGDVAITLEQGRALVLLYPEPR